MDRMLLPSVESLLWPSNRRDSCGMKMKLNSILNTNQWPSAAPQPRTMQYEVPHHHLAVQHHDMSTPAQYTHQNLYVPNGRIKSENGSDRGVSPHNSDTSRYSSQAPSLHPGYQQSMNGIPNGMRYPSPAPLHGQMPMIQHSYHPSTASDVSYTHAHMQPMHQAQDQGSIGGGRDSTGSASLPKAFACSTCGKGFARRSDLARHGMRYSFAFSPRRTLTLPRAHTQWPPTTRL